jgi:hypothetical protein
VFLDGQQNLAALTVPGVYGDIILPSPFIVGTPTNIMGLVGVASWGPLNAMIYFSAVTDGAVALGPPAVRKYDIMSYVEAATQVGGAIGFGAVRVSDGSDTAASAAVQPVAAAAATGTFTFTNNPTNSSTITLGTSTWTFVTSGATGNQTNIGANLSATLTALQSNLSSSADSQVVQCTYGNTATTLTVTDKTTGVAGNSFAIATNVSGASVSGATLSGGAPATQGVTITALYTGTLGNSIQFSIQNGSAANSYMAIVAFPGLPPEQFNNITGSGNAFWVNLAAAINSGNASHSSPSKYVTAAAGVATVMPTVGSATILSTGTDGATGVTDTTLMGQDTLPRKGMYVLRGSLCTDFTLCDMATTANWAAASAFALSELMTPVFATVSGDTITNALASVLNSGDDTPWGWAILGDWPYFYDAYNGLNRSISPAAFGIGILGNLSPQQSPLNKPLQGITGTQRSQQGLPYSDAELTLINTGRLDAIIPPANSWGGYYFTFGSGRNLSSNTAANGIEYTRMTNFLMRTAKSKAAGAVIGQLQSIQPNDQTRANAKALFDGFSAQLASPQVGLGIGGQGMIDAWAVQCDLNNNPPALQALGYLFLYWQVRYLNVVRYFVVKFMGGGNVTVSLASATPTIQQLLSQPAAAIGTSTLVTSSPRI